MKRKPKTLITMWLKLQQQQKGGRNYKKLSSSNDNFADRVALLLKYDMEFGSPDPVRSYVTPNNVRLGDWLHEQCKKYKDGRLSESGVKTLNGPI
jgi:predicted secreted acid phosphatase